MKFILGKKLEMTQVFDPEGKVVPVTKIQVGPCLVIQKKNMEKDGYVAIRCAYQEKKKFNKPMLGIFKRFSKNNFQYIKEFSLAEGDVMVEKLNEGDEITAGIFQAGDMVDVVGQAKGKGFQGVVKRHGFSGGKKSHGHKDQLRMPGSIGSAGAARVFKGMRMGGRMGGQQVTVNGLEVINVDAQNGILYLKGAVPGARNGFLKISAEGDFEIIKKVVKVEKIVEKQEVVEVVKEENQVEKNKINEIKAEEINVVKDEKKDDSEKVESNGKAEVENKEPIAIATEEIVEKNKTDKNE
ncbi:50S ribosomal protein L3 [Candidatus Falkowbacteria bacterium RIFOXYD2_FULL_35_9]|uniref:Large ribosomal subunit protein uL3 n=1 Tax=Candidatus Falkowbacteria bacterium RIFOXYC2_FULL_36_12 TaxID=1798002 RepID=A0A1F5SW94_9BACT|nr:MAG: 50S ribosomal protein L3 [Candidatus Falkowbacteria bacterium RIFOXYB2_FULL_35_7]OGF30980.1 MAG: 50S ribosomal protein L3 [Candidatus Falkowbacteria bacterium RIFOXYC2_FULL_36_12]OGF34408.1 MAG: 50S ribosomal protein L3 [Candidatus Falkowbacteria bacterium RIFOXYA2_FULL_35_8]OGF47305.1 MAG: 50S ribosomal protein L3 [Candidatus Falkowbacteria bacterium RIFOXYD2_FULL_35_9]